MTSDELIANLQVFSCGAIGMSTVQFANCFSMNHKAISRMRQVQRFPIKEKSVGSKTAFSLEKIARYSQDDETISQVKNLEVVSKIEPPKSRALTEQAPVPYPSSLWKPLQISLLGNWRKTSLSCNSSVRMVSCHPSTN